MNLCKLLRFDWRINTAICSLGMSLAVTLPTHAAPPAWWAERGITVNGAAPEDYAILNLGQLKNMASGGAEEFGFLPGGSGAALDNLITGWIAINGDDYAACNLGQLKAVGSLFWGRWITATGTGNYPWTASTADDDDFALANIGQLKNVFNFNIGGSDTDSDTLPDWWEIQETGGLTALGNEAYDNDYDQDGITDYDEFLYGLDPSSDDSATAAQPIAYDLVGRLQAAGSVNYTYDAEGNIATAGN